KLDQYDVIDKHTQSGLDLVERYIKFVKERTEIEQNYAKQLRSLTKKYYRRGSKEEQECRYSNHASFQDILNELNDYAGQRELIAENMMTGICVELTKFLQDLKQERKSHLSDAKKAQQTLESSFKHLESTKKRFAKEWAEAEKATQQADKTESDPNATKPDVEKARQHAHARTHTAEECRNDYAAELQKYNKEQNLFYYIEIPQFFNKLQEMDERRIRRLAGGYCQFSDIEKKVLPIISKCLEGISAAGGKVDEKQDSMLLIEQHKSGFEQPGDVEFEDYSHGIKPNRHCATDRTSSYLQNKSSLYKSVKSKWKKRRDAFVLKQGCLTFSLKPVPGRFCIPLAMHHVAVKTLPTRWILVFTNTRIHLPPPAEDFSHLPPEQRKKKLQAKIDDIAKELQKTQDQSDALEKMRGVYEQNPQLGDPSSLEPQISETSQNIGRLRGELTKYETWLSEAMGGEDVLSEQLESQHLYSEFDDEFDDVQTPIGQCKAIYTFEGNSEGTISITEGEQLSVMEDDKGDGWMRVLKANGEEGYIPSSYVKLVS
uniref:Cdc42-interacting protein 4 homolog n=1 Tax=Gouania willdenowi TaxID=441366 RepID=A0A8C5DB82_GOUWI